MSSPCPTALSPTSAPHLRHTTLAATQEPPPHYAHRHLNPTPLTTTRPTGPTGADLNERNAAGDTAMLYIARQGHYKFPPKEIPAALITAGANLEAKDSKGMTALQVALLSGWQNIAEILIKGGASTAGVAEVKPRLTCPDCKRLVAQYNL